jgi:hypothetical protein
MGKINIGRLILGGIVAGIVGDVLDYLVDGVLLAQRWSDEMLGLNKNEFSTTQLIEYNLIGLGFGILAVWIYVSMRSRFGAGWKTAIYAGVTAWAIGVLLPNAGFMCVMGLFSKHLTLFTTLGGLVEFVAGTVAGAALYKEG